MLKIIIFLTLFFLPVLPLSAQEAMKSDSVYVFRFVAEKDMFFIPYGGNQAELQRLSTLIRQNYEAITKGEVPVYVDGHCNGLSGEAENLATARIRANRIKSELIVHQGLREKHFVTNIHAEKGNWVTVRLLITAPHDIETVPEKETAVPEEISVLPQSTIHEVVAATAEPVKEEATIKAPVRNMNGFALRTNLLRWATFTPDLGVEWRINRNIGVLVNGSWTSWSWSNKGKRYALWKVSPEVRYYIGKEKRGYLGAIYHIGEFNYKLGDTGKQGDYQGGGITGGYQLELNRSLSLDFHAGIGYTYADYDTYKVTDGVRVRRESKTKNYWGINQFGVTLVWKLN